MESGIDGEGPLFAEMRGDLSVYERISRLARAGWRAEMSHSTPSTVSFAANMASAAGIDSMLVTRK